MRDRAPIFFQKKGALSLIILIMRGDGAGCRGGFNELRPGADDGGDFHLMMGVRCLFHLQII
jgi:hypothetical protein